MPAGRSTLTFTSRSRTGRPTSHPKDPTSLRRPREWFAARVQIRCGKRSMRGGDRRVRDVDGRAERRRRGRRELSIPPCGRSRRRYAPRLRLLRALVKGFRCRGLRGRRTIDPAVCRALRAVDGPAFARGHRRRTVHEHSAQPRERAGVLAGRRPYRHSQGRTRRSPPPRAQ